MIHYSEDKRMLEYGLMKSYPGIFCFSTTRHGGYSTGEYASFNCNNYCGDVMENILKNRSLLCSLLPGTEKELVIPHQVHRAEVRVVDRAFCKQPESLRASLLEGVDALVTDVPGKCICVSTADCVPVMCFDTKQGVVAAIHAGWRGTVARIVTETLQVMNRTYGTQGKDIVACIGPSISLEAFEVGDEVYTCFEQQGFDMQRIASRQEKWHIDLWEANRMQLLDFGVLPSNIELSGICTWKENADFFSARRQGIASGRILSGIMLKSV